MRITITVPDAGCTGFASTALESFIKNRANGSFPSDSAIISGRGFAALISEKKNGNYSVKCWREPVNISEAA
ncbi:hypothetical protein [Rahnella victoriana]|uniref:hypothetical protein n=1 Tax=Rahnella victoriana TaxID=1510570 RepID=UPI000F50476E|nr:hypothetical protein [Rahnella victoriana]